MMPAKAAEGGGDAGKRLIGVYLKITMTDTPRYLITTADERTWKFDRPVLFLGEWCRIYDRRHVWEKMDAIVADPYGISTKQKVQDTDKIEILFEKLFPCFVKVMNHHHGSSFTKRFWSITLGNWFHMHLKVLLNRIKTIKQCLHLNKPYGSAVLDDHQSIKVAGNSSQAYDLYLDTNWNRKLYEEIITSLNPINFNLEKLRLESRTDSGLGGANINRLSMRQIISKTFKDILNNIPWKVEDNSAFLISTYLGTLEEILVQVRLGQFPRLWQRIDFMPIAKPDFKLRQQLAERLLSHRNGTDDINHIICMLLFKNIPVVMLEGFKELHEVCNSQKWPQKPKFIFTSNDFNTHDVFKLWSAYRTDEGSSLIIGQHGNNYGTHRFLGHSIEERNSDKFITWGWRDGLRQHLPAFILKKSIRESPSLGGGRLLFIQSNGPTRNNTWDDAFEYCIYQTNLIKFAECLKPTVKAKLIIRLYPSFRALGACEDSFWDDYGRGVQVEKGQKSIKKLIRNSRLVVHGYDSTGLLETLSTNIPSMAYLPCGLDGVRDTAQPFYEMLAKAKIIYFKPEDLAEHINEIWFDVDRWWLSAVVQNARDTFCQMYARQCDRRVQVISQLIQC